MLIYLSISNTKQTQIENVHFEDTNMFWLEIKLVNV